MEDIGVIGGGAILSFAGAGLGGLGLLGPAGIGGLGILGPVAGIGVVGNTMYYSCY